MSGDTRKVPHFVTEGEGGGRRLFLHCSMCEARMREIGQEERIAVDRPYYCADCQVDIGVAAHRHGSKLH